MLPVIRTILYATDLPPYGSAIFRYAVRLARQFDAKLVLLHVLEPLGETAETLVRGVVPAETFEAVRKEGLERIREEIRGRLERFSNEELGEEAGKTKLVTEVHIREGRPGAVIVEEARVIGADMIVLGARSHTAVEQLFLGSVAAKVVHSSDIPVLLVPVADPSA